MAKAKQELSDNTSGKKTQKVEQNRPRSVADGDAALQRTAQALNDELPITLTVAQACEAIGMTSQSITKMINNGDIFATRPAHGKGRKWLIPRWAILEYLGLPTDEGLPAEK